MGWGGVGVGGAGVLDRNSTFRGRVAGKEGVTSFMGGCNFHIKNKLKSEICTDKKGL